MAGAVELSRRHGIYTLFLAMPHAPQECLARMADSASTRFRSVLFSWGAY